MSHTSIFPYVVRSRPAPHAPSPHGLFALGHDLQVALLACRTGVGGDGLARVLPRDELHALGIEPSRAYLRALGRLHDEHRRGLLPWSVVAGPCGRPALVFHHPFLAASCMLLPELYEHASQRLREEQLRVVAPSRDRMIVLPAAECDDAMRLAVFVRSIGRQGAPLTLSAEPFVLDPAGISAVRRPREAFVSSTAIEIEVEIDVEIDVEPQSSRHAA